MALLCRWVEAVVTRFRTYTNWPIESLKMDDLIQVRHTPCQSVMLQVELLAVDALMQAAGRL
jgi:hypothetical protein